MLSPEALGRYSLAVKLACGTELGVEQARALLARDRQKSSKGGTRPTGFSVNRIHSVGNRKST